MFFSSSLLRCGLVLSSLLFSALVVACGDDGNRAEPDGMMDAPMDAPMDGPPLPKEAPATLKETGLCVDDGCTQVSAGISSYVPRWQLWTDGATKKRWISLPTGAKIDNSDPDHWKFPTGARLWKEFSLGGTRVETRYMEKLPPGDEREWLVMSYAWNPAQNEAVAVPSGREDANGTTHDIPSRALCRDCHNNITGRILGFSALALDAAGAPGDVDLEDIATAGWLTTALPGTASPRYPLPTGNNSAENLASPAALGYLHINCGHCHNPDSPVFPDPTPLQLRLKIADNGLATLAGTTIYQTAVGVTTAKTVDGSTILVKPGDATDSVLVKRVESLDLSVRMPQLGSVVVDTTGAAAVRAWVNAIPAQ